MKTFKTTISVIVSMLMFILFVKLCMDNQEQHAYALRVLALYWVIINLYGFLGTIMGMKKESHTCIS